MSVLFLWVSSQAVQAQPTAPDNIRTWGLKNDRVKITWRDNSDNEDEFRIERSTNGGGFSEVGTVPADEQGFENNGVDLSANSYQYRVRAFRSSDTSFSGYTAVADAPQYLSGTNIRVFYNTSNAPAFADGNSNLTPSGNNGMGDNDYAARQLLVTEGALTEYFTNFGFNSPYNPISPDLLPVNLKYCDGGGCAGGCGIGLAPAFLAAYNHTTNTGNAASVLIAVHELFHMVQFSYDAVKTDPAGGWVVEAQARAIQDLVCVVTGTDPCINVDDDPTGIANYFGEINAYLGNPNRPINELSYTAAIFWVYLCDHYGSTMSEPHKGLDFLEAFWDEADDDKNRDGIQVIDATLMNLGSPDSFKDAFKKFVIANYAKQLTSPSIPFVYRYTDEGQMPGAYDDVKLDVDVDLDLGEQVGPLLSDVQKWGAVYHEYRPDPMEPYIQVDYSVDFTYPAFFTFLAIKGGDIVIEEQSEGYSFMKSVANDAYDKIVMIVAGLDHDVNFRYAFNSVKPVLRILDPTTSLKAIAGDKDTPEKFLTKIEVLSPSADPIEGIAANQFSFEIGPQIVPAANIVTSAYVQGQYWFVIQAPTQAANTTYDLVAHWSILTDTAENGVSYMERSDADNVLVIDRSGSMNAPASKITDAKNAAKLYVDSWREGDGVGVVSFSCDSTPIDLTLREWNDTSRDDAHTAITNILAGGGTSIGDGLNQGLGEFVDRGDSMHNWAMILLSDGNNTCDADIQDFLDGEYKTRKDNGDKIPKVHCVAIGADANRPDLENLASKTGGTYHFAAEPSGPKISFTDPFLFDIAEVYRTISGLVARNGQLLSVRGTTSRDRIDVHPFNVDAGASELVAAARWNMGNPEILLRSPSGVEHTIPFKEINNTHKVFRIGAPEPGKWEFQISIIKDCQEFCASDYLLEANLKSSLTMDLYLGVPVEDRYVGIPMPILVSLTTSGPVKGAAVNARVTNPGGAQTLLTLFDDGHHGDGGADDGIYGNTYHNVSQDGTYQVKATATGDSDLGPFNRQVQEAFYLKEDTDKDQDRIPDRYEILVGLDPDVNDAGQDPDKDKLNNFQECVRGTDPFDPDTDDGGEEDGSEVFGQRDPLEPGDDLVRPPRLVALPGVNQVILRISPPLIAAITPTLYMDVYRAMPGGEFEIFLPAVQVGDPFQIFDRQLMNGEAYRYMVKAHFGDPVSPMSGPSNEAEAMGKEDPYPPHGAVIINDGSTTTSSVMADLTLIGIDAYDPEYDFPDRDEYDPAAITTGVQDMMVSNQADLSDATWEPYQNEIPWVLEPNPMDIATVFAKFRDGMDNQSEIVHSSIMIVEGTPEVTPTPTLSETPVETPNATVTPTPVCPLDLRDLDLDDDGDIDGNDLMLLLDDLKEGLVEHDLNCDGTTNGQDVLRMSIIWKTSGIVKQD